MLETNNRKKKDGKLRILRIAHSSLTPPLRERERALARCYPNVDLEVLTTTRWREAEVDVEAMPDTLFPVRTARPLLSRHIQLFAYDPRPVIAALRAHQPHLIDMNHEPYSVACAELLTLCKWLAPQAPVVIQTAQNILRRYPPPFHWLEQRAFRSASAAYVCSETVREILRAKGFHKPAPIIPFGVDTEAFSLRVRPQTQPGKPLTIGFVGRMLPGKGLNILGDALTRLGDVDWKVLLVGDGPEREGFQGQLKEAGLFDRARFTGAINYDQVPEYFQQIDVLVMPTQTTDRIREQFGRVLVEAMASGVPVIGSTCGAIPEVIADTGLVFPEGDANALAAALRQMLSEEGLRSRMSRLGRARVEQNYTWDHVASKTYELYQQVMRAKPETSLSSSVELAA